MKPVPEFSWRSWRIAAAAVAIAFASGCGLFTPEEPKEPGGGPGIRLPNLTSPDSALFAWEQGIELKNQTMFMHAIAESAVAGDEDFRAFFDLQDSLDYISGTGANPPSNWRSRDERTFFNQFSGVRPVNYQVIVLDDTLRDDPAATDQEATYYRRYRVYAGTEPIAFGIADIVFRRTGVSDEWKMVLWVDQRDDTTYGVVRTLGRRRLDAYSP